MDSNRGLLGSVLTTQPTLLHLVFYLKSSTHRPPNRLLTNTHFGQLLLMF